MENKKYNLLLDLFEKEDGIPEIYGSIHFSENDMMLYQSKKNSSQNQNGVYLVQYIPDYLSTKINNESLFKQKIFHQVKGYAINIKGFANVEAYLKHQFKNKAKTIRRYVNRLETSFNIQYKLYYGHITPETYNDLMSSLYDMIVQRFQERGDDSKNLPKWDWTKKITFPLINKKRASIFVIFDGAKPIHISLNYHFKGILFSYISSYDIDYSKFGLGHVEIYKQVAWCIENDHKLFEMGWGDLDYKRRWSNQIYNFAQQIVYHKKSVPVFMMAQWEVIKIRVKNYLVAKEVHIKVRNLRKLIKKDSPIKEISFEVDTLQEPIQFQNLIEIDCKKKEYGFIRKLVYDFLYTYTEHIDNTKIFEIQKDKSYLIKGKKNGQKITIIS